MIFYAGFTSHLLYKPRPGTFCIGHGFQRGKSLRGNDKKRGFRIYFLQDLIKMISIDIRNEMGLNAVNPVRPKSFGNHHCSQIGATNANIYDIGKYFAGTPFLYTLMDSRTKKFHLVEHPIHLGNDIYALNQIMCISGSPQRRVHNRPMFGFVNQFTTKKCVAGFLQSTSGCQFSQ